jgi:hypothetical protein
VTGVSDSAGREIEGKCLELLKEVVPAVTRVGVVVGSSRINILRFDTGARADGRSAQFLDGGFGGCCAAGPSGVGDGAAGAGQVVRSGHPCPRSKHAEQIAKTARLLRERNRS